MAFKDITEVLEPWLDLPIKGTTYRVPSPSIETGLWCQNVVEVAAAVKAGRDISDNDVARMKLDDDQERDFNARILGPAYDEMLAAAVEWEYVKLAARTVFVWVVQDRDTAETFWSRAGRPEAPRPAPQDRKPATKKTTARQGSRGGSTPQPPPA